MSGTFLAEVEGLQSTLGSLSRKLTNGKKRSLHRQIGALNLLGKTQISISDAYFSAVETAADFFNRIGQKRPVDNA